jgi:lysophospholipase L1-like esterase
MKHLNLVLSLLLSCHLFADAPQSIPEKIDLQDGDSFVFLGDSITHQCLYTQYVETYFYTRFPERRIHFYNAGVSGDKAADALLRFCRDVSKREPDYVSILLGMNDGTYQHFDHEVFKNYENGMNEILDRIDGLGAKAIPMAPSLFDSRALNPEVAKWIKKRDEARQYYNPLLAFYGAWLQEQSLVRGLNFADMNGSLSQITQDQRRKNPTFTLIKDAVHPDPPGQVVMATSMLNDIFVRKPVSRIVISKNPKGQLEPLGMNSGIDLVSHDEKEGSINFTHLAKALPWVLPEDATLGYKLSNAGHKFSNEKVQIAGLEPGSYKLLIDGSEIATYTHTALAKGIELQENPSTPQYKQALEVALLNQERNQKAVKPLRNLYSRLKGKRNKGEDLTAWLPSWEDEVEAMIQLAKDYEDKIYQMNQPTPHLYSLQRVLK